MQIQSDELVNYLLSDHIPKSLHTKFKKSISRFMESKTSTVNSIVAEEVNKVLGQINNPKTRAKLKEHILKELSKKKANKVNEMSDNQLEDIQWNKHVKAIKQKYGNKPNIKDVEKYLDAAQKKGGEKHILARVWGTFGGKRDIKGYKQKLGSESVNEETIIGKNRSTGESFKVISQNENNGNIVLTIRKMYEDRMSVKTWEFDNTKLLRTTDHGYSTDGSPIQTKSGSGTNINVPFNKAVKIMSPIYSPTFAKKVIDYVKNNNVKESVNEQLIKEATGFDAKALVKLIKGDKFLSHIYKTKYRGTQITQSLIDIWKTYIQGDNDLEKQYKTI